MRCSFQIPHIVGSQGVRNDNKGRNQRNECSRLRASLAASRAAQALSGSGVMIGTKSEILTSVLSNQTITVKLASGNSGMGFNRRKPGDQPAAKPRRSKRRAVIAVPARPAITRGSGGRRTKSLEKVNHLSREELRGI